MTILNLKSVEVVPFCLPFQRFNSILLFLLINFQFENVFYYSSKIVLTVYIYYYLLLINKIKDKYSGI